MEKFENIISYSFVDKSLLEVALTHPSANNKRKNTDYERLEFVGDSVLSLVVSESLYNKYPKEREGALAKRRAAIVCKSFLAEIAKQISLGDYLILGVGEDQNGGRENPANLENALEALIAAIYFDSNLEQVKAFIGKFFDKEIGKIKTPPKDPKSKLQEWAQASNYSLPEYEIISITGPSHEPEITVKLTLLKNEVEVKASSRKDAEREAAEILLNKLNIK